MLQTVTSEIARELQIIWGNFQSDQDKQLWQPSRSLVREDNCHYWERNGVWCCSNSLLHSNSPFFCNFIPRKCFPRLWAMYTVKGKQIGPGLFSDIFVIFTLNCMLLWIHTFLYSDIEKSECQPKIKKRKKKKKRWWYELKLMSEHCENSCQNSFTKRKVADSSTFMATK